jgi:hypothetical protein
LSTLSSFKVNGQTLAKEFCDQDILNIWEAGLIKNPKEITGFSQYKLPSGVIRLVYSLEKKIDLGKPKPISQFVLNYISQILSLAVDFVDDPHFIFTKTVLGDTTRYNCKVLDLTSLPTAKIGSEVKVFVRFTHREIPLPQIDEWLSLYGQLTSESRY